MRALMVIAIAAVSTAAHAQSLPVAAVQAPASEQTASRECWPTPHIDQVEVQLTDRTTHRGTLLCFGRTEFTVVEKSSVARYPLGDVRRVRKAPDSVLDGAAKGAAVTLVMLVMCGGDCSGAEYLRVATAYGLLGMAIDAADTHRDTIYRPSAGKRVAVGFHVPF